MTTHTWVTLVFHGNDNNIVITDKQVYNDHGMPVSATLKSKYDYSVSTLLTMAYNLNHAGYTQHDMDVRDGVVRSMTFIRVN